MNAVNHPHAIAVRPRSRPAHAARHPRRTGPVLPAAPNPAAAPQAPDAPNGPWSDVLLELSGRLADLAADLDGPPADGGVPAGPAAPAAAPGVSTLAAPADLDAALRSALAGARQHVLAALPAGPRPDPGAWDAPRSLLALAGRGVGVRLLYRHATRFDEAAKEYAREVLDQTREQGGGTADGVRIRTLPEFFEDMIVVDGSTVILPLGGPGSQGGSGSPSGPGGSGGPGSPSGPAGLAVTHPLLVRFLADLFERAWGRADALPYRPTHAAEAARDVMPAVRGTIRRLLTEGWADAPIARRVGISTRSLQTHIAAMKEETGATTRVQLGYLLGLAAARARTGRPAGPGATASAPAAPAPAQAPARATAPTTAAPGGPAAASA